MSTAQLFHCERRPILPQQSETGVSPAADADWTKENKTMVRGRRQRWRAAVASQEMIYRLDRKQLTAQLCTISRTLELEKLQVISRGRKRFVICSRVRIQKYLSYVTNQRKRGYVSTRLRQWSSQCRMALGSGGDAGAPRPSPQAFCKA